ncbi:TraB/GumN family protein [Sphingomonas sp. BT-65]|uniref:TraB/GumN family protein n=1 Tax=Sphingomonas sp. BT-65 TaxID=2989821 RepID=UPI002235C970|nr:TraB/GumN family protein [Sphingomonas sp. BT-65]MCW4461775.1 TraB/GumN family protein [Sphingomonas sp. BT-65]
MLKRTLPALAALLLSGCSIFGSDADPALWMVKDDDTTIYLFGTVHVLKPGMRWFDEGVRDAFDASDEVVLEIAKPDPQAIAALTTQLGTRGGPPFAPEVDAAAQKLGMPKGAIDKMEPWLAALTLSQLAVAKAGYGTEDGVEAALSEAAEGAGKPVKALESARGQLMLFDGLSGAAQSAMLDATVKELPEAGPRLARFVTAWGAGDAETVGAEMNRVAQASPEVAEALIARRNARWADWVAARMAQPGTVFLAVGAGHLAGKGSVQALLAEKGIKAERVAY